MPKATTRALLPISLSLPSRLSRDTNHLVPQEHLPTARALGSLVNTSVLSYVWFYKLPSVRTSFLAAIKLTERRYSRERVTINRRRDYFINRRLISENDQMTDALVSLSAKFKDNYFKKPSSFIRPKITNALKILLLRSDFPFLKGKNTKGTRNL